MSKWIRRIVLWCMAVAGIACAGVAPAQSIERLKAGVVRIVAQSEGLKRTGSGFIVRLENDAAFIVTASHVIEGDNHPRVEFFTRRNSWVSAETVRVEGGDPRGLAVIAVRGKDNLPPNLTALPLAQAANVQGGEAVIVIGFPQGGGAWAVLRANVVSMEGRELTLDGSIGEGNSGGPVLLGENVIGVVTTVGGTGGFGHAVPTSILKLVLDGWGVQPSAQARAAPPGAPVGGAVGANTGKVDTSAKPPAESEAAGTRKPAVDTGNARVRVTRAYCEKLRGATAFRVTMYGESNGPEGAMAVTSLLRDAKVIARPRMTCETWAECKRTSGQSEKTVWKMSVLLVPPAPTEAIASVMLPGLVEDPPTASVRANVPLDCLLQ